MNSGDYEGDCVDGGKGETAPSHFTLILAEKQITGVEAPSEKPALEEGNDAKGG